MHKLLSSSLLLLSIPIATVGCDGGGDPLPDPTITTTELSSGRVGRSYSAAITGSGGSGSGYQWSVTAGTLPEGLTLAEAGTPGTSLSGTPTAEGSATFTVTLTDSAGGTAEQEFTVDVTAAPKPLVISTMALPGAEVEEPYSATITAVDGSGAGYRWSVDGDLPPGLVIDAQGTPETVISGTPTDAGSFDFSVRVRDSAGGTAVVALSISVVDNRVPLSITTASLPTGTVGQPYDAELAATGGSGAGYTWSTTEMLPDGLSIATDGTPSTRITGTPTTEGVVNIEFIVEDDRGNIAELRLFITIDAAPPPVRITTFQLPDGDENVAYSAEITTSGGTGVNYTWSVSAGALPPGLTLDTAGTPNTTLSGTPTMPGTFDFTLQVDDGVNDPDDQIYQISIAAEVPQLVLTSTAVPDGILGEPYSYQLNATGGSGRYSWVVLQGTLPDGIILEQDGTPSTFLSGTAGQSGTFTATIAVFDQLNNSDSLAISFEIINLAPPLVITTPPALPDASTCETVNIPIVAQDGSANGYTWTVSAGALPDGLQLQPMGTPATAIVGTVRVGQSGPFNFTIEVSDSNNEVISQAFTMNILDSTATAEWAVAVGDVFVDNDVEIAVVDVTNTSGCSYRLNPAMPGTADASTTYAANQFSPDGTLFAFEGDFAVDSQTDLWLVDMTGTPAEAGAVRLTTGIQANGDVLEFKFSPDSTKIAVRVDYDTEALDELYIIDVSTPATPGMPMKVSGTFTSGTGDVEFDDYYFSPNSQKIAFMADREIANVFNLYVADVSGAVPGPSVRVNQDLAPVGTSADVDDGFQWSPDSNTLFYNADAVVQFDDELWMVDVTNPAAPGTPVRLNLPLVAAGDIDYRSPSVGVVGHDWSVSPDGTKLFYIGDNVTDGFDELFVVDLTVTPVGVAVANQVLPSTGDIFSATWSPDSTQILYVGDAVTNSENEVFLVDVTVPATPGTPAVINGALVTNGDVSTGTRNFTFAPDGSKVAYIADELSDNVNELFVADISGVPPYTSIRVSDPAPASGTSYDVDSNYLWAPTSDRILFRADPVASSQTELFIADLSAFPTVPAPVRVHAPVQTNQDVTTTSLEVYWSLDGNTVVFEGDIVVDNEFNMYATDVSGAPPYTAVQISPTVPPNGDVNVNYLPGTPYLAQ